MNEKPQKPPLCVLSIPYTTRGIHGRVITRSIRQKTQITWQSETKKIIGKSWTDTRQFHFLEMLLLRRSLTLENPHFLNSGWELNPAPVDLESSAANQQNDYCKTGSLWIHYKTKMISPQLPDTGSQPAVSTRRPSRIHLPSVPGYSQPWLLQRPPPGTSAHSDESWLCAPERRRHL